jgi:hypothetical protein
METKIYMFAFELLIALVAYLIPLERRGHFWQRFLPSLGAALILLIAAGEVVYTAVTVNSAWFVLYILWYALVILLFGLVMMFSFCIRPGETLYVLTIAYATEHIAYCILQLLETVTGGALPSTSPLWHFACHIAVSIFSYFVFAKPMAHQGHYRISVLTSLGISIMILLLVFVLSFIMGLYGYTTIHAGYALALCLFILISQRGQMLQMREREQFQRREQMWETNRAQYELSRDTIAAVNQNYHDLKHKIHLLSTMEKVERSDILDDMSQALDTYDAMIHTGNEYLDTVLTEKNLRCRQEGILMKCMADGGCLSFMAPVDLYTLFGNALDNAIEANRNLDAAGRFIELQIYKKKGLVMVQM